MASEHRTEIHSVDQILSMLSEQISSYDFVAAIRQLECAHPDKPRVGNAVHTNEDVVRLSQHVALGFQGTTLHSLTNATGPQDYRLHVNFMGLLGSNGPMPLHYTEYAHQRAHHRSDPTFREFLDLFNHRLLSLFYKACVQFDPAVSFDRADTNTYSEFLGALSGLMPAASSNRDVIRDSVKRYYPGWFSDSSKSPDGIVALLSDYFDLPVSVKEWVGGWVALPTESRVRLGNKEPSHFLGRSLYLGKRVKSIRHKFRIELGPLGRENFSEFKPGGHRAKALHDLVRNYLGDEWDWDLQLIPLSDDARGIRLDRSNSLGYDSWVRSTHGKRLSAKPVLMNKNLISQRAH